MAEKTPDEIVAEIDRKQNEEDRDLIPRIGRKLKDVGSKVIKELSKTDSEAFKEYDDAKKQRRMEKDAADQEAQQKKMRTAIGAGAIEDAMRNGKPKKMAKGGTASSRADGCAVRGKTKGRMV